MVCNRFGLHVALRRQRLEPKRQRLIVKMVLMLLVKRNDNDGEGGQGKDVAGNDNEDDDDDCYGYDEEYDGDGGGEDGDDYFYITTIKAVVRVRSDHGFQVSLAGSMFDHSARHCEDYIPVPVRLCWLPLVSSHARGIRSAAVARPLQFL